MTSVNQIISSITPGDAVSYHVLALQKMLRALGYDSSIFVQWRHPVLQDRVKYVGDYNRFSSSSNVVIYHYAVGSDLTSFVKDLPDQLILNYHNITPYYYFTGVNSSLESLCKKGRDELPLLVDRCSLAVADSEYNRQELLHYGYRNTSTIPVVADLDRFKIPLNMDVVNRFSNDKNIIFVGRFAPNKRHDELIKIFHVYQQLFNAESNLLLIGSAAGCESWLSRLKSLVQALKLKNVHFFTDADRKQLSSLYRLADVFLCMSEHEGFCVPLVECMYFDVPVIAHALTAIPDTLGGSGILVRGEDYLEVAALTDLLMEDKSLRQFVVEGQRKQLARFSVDTLRCKWAECLSSFEPRQFRN